MLRSIGEEHGEGNPGDESSAARVLVEGPTVEVVVGETQAGVPSDIAGEGQAEIVVAGEEQVEVEKGKVLVDAMGDWQADVLF